MRAFANTYIEEGLDTRRVLGRLVSKRQLPEAIHPPPPLRDSNARALTMIDCRCRCKRLAQIQRKEEDNGKKKREVGIGSKSCKGVELSSSQYAVMQLPA